MTRHYTNDEHAADKLVDASVYCDVNEATQILQRSAQRVRAYIREKDTEADLNLKTAKKIKGKWFIKREEVENLHHSLKKKKQQRRVAKKAKMQQEKLEHLKAIKRVVLLDHSIPTNLRKEFLTYLKGRIKAVEHATTTTTTLD